MATRWESRKEKREGGGSGVVKDDILCVSTHYFQLDVVEFNSSWLQGLVRVQSSFEAVGNLASDANFARFWFPRLFPGLKRALYLDTDVVVQFDVSRLWDSVMSSGQLLAVVERDSPTFGDLFGDKVTTLYTARWASSCALN